MTGEEIRTYAARYLGGYGGHGIAEKIMLAEIAAQLADLNATLRAIHPELNMPRRCQERTCTYYSHYLAHGYPDLTHEGFHALEKVASEHARECRRCKGEIGVGPCAVGHGMEKRLRA